MQLKRAIKERYGSISAFCRVAKIRKDTVYRWCNGLSKPSIRYRYRIRHAIGFNIDDYELPTKKDYSYTRKRFVHAIEQRIEDLDVSDYTNLNDLVKDTFGTVSAFVNYFNLSSNGVYKALRGFKDVKIGPSDTYRVLEMTNGKLNLAIFPESSLHEYWKLATASMNK